MSGSGTGTGGNTAKKSRDTLSSIYTFYANNRESLERVPSFVSQSSQDIPIMLQADTVPSDEQAEALKKQLKELVETKEAIDNILDKERQLMIEATNASTIRRKGGK